MRLPESLTVAVLFVLFIALPVAVVPACSSGGAVVPGPAPSPAPIFDLRGVVTLDGAWKASVFLGGAPVLTLIEGSGRGTLTILPHPPWATFDLERTGAVVPSAEAVAALADGRLLIRRDGAPAGFAPPPAPVEAPAPAGAAPSFPAPDSK